MATLKANLAESQKRLRTYEWIGTLNDGTSYTAQTTLDAKAKNIRVVVENSGHRPLPR